MPRPALPTLPAGPRTGLLAVLLAGFLAASLVLPAHAAPPRPYIAAHAGFGTYAMGDVNDELHAVNTIIAPFHLDDIKGGGTFGAEFGFTLPGGDSFGVAYDRLSGSSSVGDDTGSITYDVPANVFRLTGAHVFGPDRKVRGRIGGSFGVVSETGSLNVGVAGSGAVRGDIRGTSAMAELLAGLEVAAAPQLDVTLDAGYRRARAGGIEVEGTPVYNAAGEPYAVDFSGLVVRAGLRLGLAR